MFWMNMLHAEKANWAGYSPGAMPDDIRASPSTARRS